ncbi:MAG: hypothetical protein M3Y04_05300 [Actinomycetota bacterium]|nr:hypothetical protein [Actinomycetota bacterium]
MSRRDPADLPRVQEACAELAERFPGLTVHQGAAGHLRAPYVSGTLASAEAPPVEIRRSIHWDGEAVVVRVAGGPYGAWAKPLIPDPEDQEGGLTFVPDHRDPPPNGLLYGLPAAQSDLHDLWQVAHWQDDDGATHDGLIIQVRPDGVVGHLRIASVTADTLETLVRCLPEVATGAESHDPDWRETVRPHRDTILYPAIVIVAGIAALLILYVLYLKFG